ncbi:MAG: hypothetical protein M4D80_17695 [Myxococcota bacterium]|nr:hypothetical protein [Myxococcota bacterium]
MRRSLRLELAIVIALAAALYVPGIASYSLLDPWETHYGEVARTMLQEHDYVHTKWNGTTNSELRDIEGFRSKPVLMFWMMAAGLQAVGVGDDGGYSGEMVDSARVMFGMRIPFVACAIAGLALLWWMLARLVNRRVAWLAFLVVATTPMFCLIARQAIPDMAMVACTMGAIALFAMAVEDGERAVEKRALYITLGLAGVLLLVQAIYMAKSFANVPQLAVRNSLPLPGLWIPLIIVAAFAALSRTGWLVVRLPFVLVGAVICAIRGERLPRTGVLDVLDAWDKHALDRYLLAGAPLLVLAPAFLRVPTPTRVALVGLALAIGTVWSYLVYTGGWAGFWRVIDHLRSMGRITTMRQVYLLGCYFLLGVGLLAKGPTGFTVVVGVAGIHTALFARWRSLYEGGYEIKRGLLMLTAVAVPWHVGMFLKEGLRFVDEYIFQHILNRAGDGSVDKSLGTFAFYTDLIGHGMWLWAALLPAALVGILTRVTQTTRQGRVRILTGIWAIVSVFVFCFVQTKFNHYILPAVPALGVVVAFYLDELLARRERMHALYGALAIGIVLLACRDLAMEPDRWVEMFVYRYDRPWPAHVDPSDGFLALGGFAIAGIVTLCITRWGVLVLGAAAIATSVWALHVYMPHAGKHWGMRDAFATYYRERTIYGHKRVFFGAQQCARELRGTGETWRFETFVPDTLHVDQPMTVTLSFGDETAIANARVTAVDDHEVTMTLVPGERAKIEAFAKRCAGKPQTRGRPTVEIVDADPIIAWQLYWRGEQFWSGGDVWAVLPEQKTSFVPGAEAHFAKYINDRARAPLGRRYFAISTSGGALSLRNLLPTARAKESFEVINTDSNKFSLAAFDL